MKKLLQLFILLFAFNLNAIAQSVDLQKGLVAYFPFDGNAVDETGSGVYGIVNGATLTNDRNGKPNAAYKFTNISDYIKIPLTSKNFENDYSISCWVSFDDFSISYPSVIIGEKNFIALHGQGAVYKKDQDKVVFYQDNSTKQAENRIVKPILTEKLKPNTFYHITVVKSAEKCTIYLNGAKQSEGNVKKSAMVNGSFIRIGNAFRQSTNRCLKGKVDEVFIYNRALNTAEIAKLYETEILEIVLEKAEVVISKKEAARLAKIEKKKAAEKNKETARLAKIAKQKEVDEEKEIVRLAKEKIVEEAIGKQEEVEKEKEIVEVEKKKVDKEVITKQEKVKKEVEVVEVEKEKVDKKKDIVEDVKEKEEAKQSEFFLVKNGGKYMPIKSKDNCLIWSEVPISNEEIKWKGTCLDGYVHGKGKVTWYKGNKKPLMITEGVYQKGKLQGQAIIYKKDKTYYEISNFQESLRKGYCELFFNENKTLYFKGNYNFGKKEGKGEEKEVEYKYSGMFKNDVFSGVGVLQVYRKKTIFGDIKFYEGDFKKGKVEGQGEATLFNGNKYKGKFVNNKMHGQGSIKFSDNTYYQGEFVNNKMPEYDFYLKCKKENTKNTFNQYLKKYPTGWYVDEARKRIRELERVILVTPKTFIAQCDYGGSRSTELYRGPINWLKDFTITFNVRVLTRGRNNTQTRYGQGCTNQMSVNFAGFELTTAECCNHSFIRHSNYGVYKIPCIRVSKITGN